MFIGNLVKLKSNITRYNKKESDFINNAIEGNWIWLITAMDDESLDYIIQPIYLEPESSSITQLGAELFVTYDEIEKVDYTKEELFRILNKQMNLLI